MMLLCMFRMCVCMCVYVCVYMFLCTGALCLVKCVCECVHVCRGQWTVVASFQFVFETNSLVGLEFTKQVHLAANDSQVFELNKMLYINVYLHILWKNSIWYHKLLKGICDLRKVWQFNCTECFPGRLPMDHFLSGDME